MKFEINKRHYKKLMIGIISGIFIILGVGLITSLAKYEHVQDILLVNGSVSYKPSDMSMVALYKKDSTVYEEIDDVPSSGYVVNESKSYCEVNQNKVSNVVMEYKNGALYFGNVLKKGTKCFVYLDKYVEPKTMDTILASYNTSTRSDFSVAYSSENSKTVYTASDGLGTSKYFAGAPLDNYVKFGGFYWRIVRMNGDKTTRLIYSGESSVIDALENKQEVLANGYHDYATNYTMALNDVQFNAINTDNAYVGFKYTMGILRGLNNKSTILTELDTWYEANLKTDYGKYIDGSTGFCGDRTSYTDMKGTVSGGGTGTTGTYYGAYFRLYKSKAPQLTCPNSSDLYTTSGSSRGNSALSNPIGLLTADEVSFAGAVINTDNYRFYLYNWYSFWLLTPATFNTTYNRANVHILDQDIESTPVSSSNAVKPVINLKADVKYVGSGTFDDPYTVVYN